MDKRKKLKRVLGVIVLSFALLGMILFVPNSSSYAYALQDEEDFVLETSSLDDAFVWGEKVFAPYVQLSSGNKINVNDVYEATGQKYYTFAFMNSNNGIPAWRGKYNYDRGMYKKEIADLRSNGGNIIISFGGAGGRELATEITDVTKLREAYQSVIEYYDLTWIDLDIEGDVLRCKKANMRRNEALVELQKIYPNVVYAYCLPADPRGLSSKAVELLKDAKQRGVRVDVVNVMAMDYGDSIVPNPEGNMGYCAIKTAENTKKQLEYIGYNDTKVGVTAMIGVNGVNSEVFRTSDAKEVLDWANRTDWVRYLGFWSVNRDNGNGAGNKKANSDNSSIRQSLYEFTNIFKTFKKGTIERSIRNLALNKKAKCSSVEAGTNLVAQNAVDGSIRTRWASDESSNNPEWLLVDLGSVNKINRLDIKWEKAYAKAYKIGVSTDGKKFKAVSKVKNNKSRNTVDEFDLVDARYVVVYCTEKATPYGYSIYEVCVLNTIG